MTLQLCPRAVDAAREAFDQARQELEYFGASEDFTRSPLEAAIDAYLGALGFDGLVELVKTLLDAHYPRDLMENWPDEPGPAFVLAVRDAMERLP